MQENINFVLPTENYRFDYSDFNFDNLKYLIGIDAGKYTGVMLYDLRYKKFITGYTFNFWKTYDFVLQNFGIDETVIVIEKLLKHTALYARTWQGRQSGRDRVAANVGSVRRETELLTYGLKRRGYIVVEIVVKGHKWDEETFKRLTNLEIRSSQHVRDAARIVYLAPEITSLKRLLLAETELWRQKQKNKTG